MGQAAGPEQGLTPLTNLELADLLEEIGDLLELKGDEGFRVRAYRRAARVVRGLGEPVQRVAEEGRLRSLPGVGPALAAKIQEMLTTGTSQYLEKLREEIPPGLREVMLVPGVGPRTAALLHSELGVADLESLEAAARAGRLRSVPRLGLRREEAILEGVARVRARGGLVPLAVARPLALELAAMLARRSEVVRVEVAGSVRRWCETVEAVVLVAAGPDPARIVEAFGALPGFREPPERSAGRARGRWGAGVPVELEATLPEAFGVAMVRLTGSEAHWRRLEERAQGRGMRLGPAGLCVDGRQVPCDGEDELYRLLGLPPIPPELRENGHEVEEAAAGRLPRLLEPSDIRGDLHVHTDWSDGTASLEEMAIAARSRGYEYLAITDHSRSLAFARGLDVARLRGQAEAVAALNHKLAPFRVLAGIEVDILADGSLDLPDAALAELDFVIASVHSRMRQDRVTMTARLLRAIASPHVDVIGHLTGRLIGEREPCELDHEAVLEACAASGTALEINASPHRLDVDRCLARQARDRGVTLTLGTDAHDRVSLEDMAFGVGTARRARLGPGEVLNTLSADELLACRKG